MMMESEWKLTSWQDRGRSGSQSFCTEPVARKQDSLVLGRGSTILQRAGAEQIWYLNPKESNIGAKQYAPET